MNARLNKESSERAAGFFRSLRARIDLTLGDCANAMGLTQAADATLARMENAIGTWRTDRFDAFVPFAADSLGLPINRLRSTLLGDGRLDQVDDVVGWNYARLGSDAASRLLCRLECDWRARSHWTLYFRQLPGFLLPDRPRQCLDRERDQLFGRDTGDEVSAVFAAMHDRFLCCDTADRPAIVALPMDGGMFSGLLDREPYGALDADAVVEAAEFLLYDCIQCSGTIVAKCPPRGGVTIRDVDWLLIGESLAVRQRPGVPVLDYMVLSQPQVSDGSVAMMRVRRLADHRSHRAETLMAESLLERALQAIRGELAGVVATEGDGIENRDMQLIASIPKVRR